MLIIGENQEDANILHIIIGPETDFQFNMSGQSIMDVTEYVSKFKDGKKCIIVLNQCNSEEELVQELQIKQARNKAATILQQYAEQEALENPDDGHSFKKESKKEKTTTDKSGNHGLKCPKCHAPNAAIIMNGEVHQCLVCKKIDEGIKTGIVPPPPTKDELDKIRENTENENPLQKKSRARFFKKPIEGDKGIEDGNKNNDV